MDHPMLIEAKGKCPGEKSAIYLKHTANTQKIRKPKINPYQKTIPKAKGILKAAVGINKTPATRLIKNQGDIMAKND